MGLFDTIFRPRKNREMAEALKGARQTFQLLNAYEPVFRTWNGCIYEASLVRSAIDTIARNAAKLKVNVKGAAKPKLSSLLNKRPNSFQTWYQFLYQTFTILYVNNTVFICPMKNDQMETCGFIPVVPSQVSLVEYKNELWIRYRFKNGQIGACKWNESAVLTRFQYDDIFGASNDALKETMDLIKLNSDSIKEAVKNSNSFRFMGILSNFSKDSDLQAEAKRFSELNFSKQNNGSPLLLFPNNYKDVKQITSTPLTVDTKQMELIQKNIQTYFGVSEAMLNGTAKGDELDAFYENVISGLAIQLKESMTFALYSEREITQGNEFHVSANRLSFMTITQKISMARDLADRGVLMIDEIRALFDYEPLPDGNGQHTPIRGEYYLHDKDEEDTFKKEDSQNAVQTK